MRARSALASALCQPVSCGFDSRASCKIACYISGITHSCRTNVAGAPNRQYVLLGLYSSLAELGR